MNVLLKRSAEFLLVRSGLLRAARAHRRLDTLVLAYHNIVPRGETACGDGSLHLAQQQFGEQLDVLASTHTVVPLARMLEPHEPSRRPRVVITFDDAYQGALTAGLEELQRRSLPATFFIAPAFVGGRTFWWDELAAARGGVLSDRIRRYCIEELAGRHDDIVRWAAQAGFRAAVLPAHQAAATEAQLKRAASSAGVAFAAHSWSHPNLCAISEIELRHELSQALEWLQKRFAATVPWLSYPYGLSSSHTQSVARQAGYRGAFKIDGGWLPSAPQQPFALARTNIPSGLSSRGFAILTSGLLPMQAPVALSSLSSL